MCQPGVQLTWAKGSSRYHGWSKNEGCLAGFVPSIRLRFSILRPSAALGVGNAMTSGALLTIFVVVQVFSCGVNRLGIPNKTKRRSTSSGLQEIICDNLLTDVVVSNSVRNFPYRCFHEPQHARY